MHCAVKRFRFSKDDAALTETFANEVFLLKNLSHDNLVRFFGACTTPPNLCILTELMTGSLLSLLYGSLARRPDGTLRELNDKRQAHILKGVATGMAFLHSHSVAHRDLKSANVLYDKQLNIKLCDFAFSKFKRQLSGLMDSQVGTPAWMAPEVLRGDEYTLKCDVFSAGVIMWELVHREEPLKGVNQYAVAIKVGMEGHRLPIDKSCPLIWRRLMESCWAEPDDRPSFAEIEGILTEAKRSIKHGATLRELSSNGAVGSSTANHKPGSDVVLLDPHASAAAARATSAVRKPVSTPTPEVVAALAALTKQPSTDAEAQDDSTSASAAAPSPAGSGSGGGEDDGSEGGGARRIPEGVPIRMMSRPGQGPSSSDRIGNSVSPRAAKAPSAEATWEGGAVARRRRRRRLLDFCLFLREPRGPRAAAAQQAPAPLRWPTGGPCRLGSFFDHPKPAPLLNHKFRVFEARRRRRRRLLDFCLFLRELRGPRAAAAQQAPAPLRWPTGGPCRLGSFFDHPKPAPPLNHPSRVSEARRRRRRRLLDFCLFLLELRGSRAAAAQQAPAPLRCPTGGPCWPGSFFDHPKPAPPLNHPSRVSEARRRHRRRLLDFCLFLRELRGPHIAATQQATVPQHTQHPKLRRPNVDRGK